MTGRGRIWPLLALMLLTAIGLLGWWLGPWRTQKANPTPQPVAQEDPPEAVDTTADRRVRDYLRQGSVRAEGALNTLRDARQECAARIKGNPTLADALQETLALLDEGGRELAVCASHNPGTNSTFTEVDDERLDRIEHALGALTSIEQAFGIVSSLATEWPNLVTLKRMITLCEEDTRRTVEGFGGTL